MKIGQLSDGEKHEASKAADAYYKAKTKKPSEAVLGFIKNNYIVGKTTKEIDALVKHAEKLSGGAILGEGDKFKVWCEKLGREVPSDDLVRLMNADPHDAKAEVKKMIPINPKLWTSYSTYLAGRGR